MGRWYAGNNHGDEPCRRSDGHVWRDDGDERGGGSERDTDRRHDTGRQRTVTVTVNGQSGSLANVFTYNATVAIGFSQVAAATPQSSTTTVSVTYPGAQTVGDLKHFRGGMERYDRGSAIGEG
jgi:hypothetical protein